MRLRKNLLTVRQIADIIMYVGLITDTIIARRTCRKTLGGFFVPAMNEPQEKRVVAFVDGQNLFNAAKMAFGYLFIAVLAIVTSVSCGCQRETSAGIEVNIPEGEELEQLLSQANDEGVPIWEKTLTTILKTSSIQQHSQGDEVSFSFSGDYAKITGSNSVVWKSPRPTSNKPGITWILTDNFTIEARRSDENNIVEYRLFRNGDIQIEWTTDLEYIVVRLQEIHVENVENMFF